MTATGLAERVLVSQLGARMHYAVPRLLHGSGNLEHFYTDICATKGWPRYVGTLPRAMLPGALRRLTDRVTAGVPADRLTCFNAFGLRFALRRARMRTAAQRTQTMIWGGQRLSRLVVESGFGRSTAVYAYSGESRELLSAAKARGLRTAVEQIIAPRPVLDRLIREEETRFPGWEQPSGEDRFAEAYAERERAEWSLADTVVCGSDFVREGVIAEGGDPDACIVVPYGVELGAAPRPRSGRDGPLRILTVGGIGLRKGAPYILEAAQRLGRAADFRLVGPCLVGDDARRRLEAVATVVDAVPRSEIAKQLAWADVFLLPSICEGSATAVYEALAAGLPVVTTPNTGTVVRDGKDGFVVPIRDGDAIADALDRLARKPALRAEMGHDARLRAAEFDIESYGRRLRAALASAWSATPAPGVGERHR